MEDALTDLVAHRAGIDAAADVRPRTWAKVGIGCLDAAYRVWLGHGGDLETHLEAAFTATRDPGAAARSRTVGGPSRRGR